MPALPPDLHDDYPEKGETFFTIAEIVLTNHGRQLTADDIADRVEPEYEGVRQHLKTLEDDGWIDGANGPKRYTWDTQQYNPAEHDPHEAVGSVTADAITLAKRATRSPAELFAVVAIIGLTTGVVVAASGVIAAVLPIGTTPPLSYAAIGGGFALGSLLTLGLVSLGAWVARFR
jgi:hypothetical protein